jgi:hypothetical protein
MYCFSEITFIMEKNDKQKKHGKQKRKLKDLLERLADLENENADVDLCDDKDLEQSKKPRNEVPEIVLFESENLENKFQSGRHEAKDLKFQRTEAWDAWKRDKLGSFSVLFLQKINFLIDKRKVSKNKLLKPISKTHTFEYRERQSMRGVTMSKTESQRRKNVAAHKERATASKLQKKLNSEKYRRMLKKENSFLEPRRCLSALIQINLCCGIKLKYIGPKEIIERKSFLCATDIFNARANMLDVSNRMKWITSQCSAAGSGPLKYDGLPLCDKCFGLMNNVAVSYTQI